jgi:hypothetical protein
MFLVYMMQDITPAFSVCRVVDLLMSPYSFVTVCSELFYCVTFITFLFREAKGTARVSEVLHCCSC